MRRKCGVEAGAAAVWRSWCGADRNNPLLHRQRGGHPCHGCFAVPLFRFIDSVTDTPVVSCETGTHQVQTLPKTVEIFAVDVPVMMQFEFQQPKVHELNVPQIPFWTFLVCYRDVPRVLTVQNTVEIPQVPQ